MPLRTLSTAEQKVETVAIICRKHNLLFIMSPRTACTAIGQLLCQYYDGEFLPRKDILDCRGFIAVQKKHSTLAELIAHNLLTEEEAKSLLKLAAVRNPYDSLVSLYLKKRYKYQSLLSDPSSWVNRLPGYANDMRYSQKKSFNQWSCRMSYKKVIKALLGLRPSMYADHTRGVDIVLHYESIEHDLKEVFMKNGIEWKADIPKVNRTDERVHRDYRSFYSRPAALAVGLAYRYDLKTYGYKF